MIKTMRLKIYPATQEQMEEFIASQRVLEKCGFAPNGKMGEEGPRYVLRKKVK